MLDADRSRFDDRRVQLFALLETKSHPALDPEDTGGQLLHRLLLPRVQNVYGAAARPWPDDSEPLVHDVRVASRRLVEALALVQPVVGPRRARRAQRYAKTVRRALGASREADVLVADFRRLTQAAGMDQEVVHALDAMTAHGQEALAKAMASYTPEALLRQGVDVLRFAARPRSDRPLYALASNHLYDRAQAALPLVGSLEVEAKWPEHHELRIKCKHLRYTVEILATPFADCMDGKSIIDRIKGLQDALGVLNDAQDLIDWLDRPMLVKTLGKPAVRTVRAAADAERKHRYTLAREKVLGEAPVLLGDLRRAAGVIGPLAA